MAPALVTKIRVTTRHGSKVRRPFPYGGNVITMMNARTESWPDKLINRTKKRALWPARKQLIIVVVDDDSDDDDDDAATKAISDEQGVHLSYDHHNGTVTENLGSCFRSKQTIFLAAHPYFMFVCVSNSLIACMQVMPSKRSGG